MFIKKLLVYKNNHNYLSIRAHVDVIGKMCTLNSFLVTNRSNQLRNISLAKSLHRYLDALLVEILEILRVAKETG